MNNPAPEWHDGDDIGYVSTYMLSNAFFRRNYLRRFDIKLPDWAYGVWFVWDRCCCHCFPIEDPCPEWCPNG